MKRLQNESVQINQQLHNRQKVSCELSQFVADIIVPATMIRLDWTAARRLPLEKRIVERLSTKTSTIQNFSSSCTSFSTNFSFCALKNSKTQKRPTMFTMSSKISNSRSRIFAPYSSAVAAFLGVGKNSRLAAHQDLALQKTAHELPGKFAVSTAVAAYTRSL